MCAIVLFVALDFAVHRRILYQSYLSLEEKEAGKDISRCLGALQREIDNLNSFAYDWAAWDDTYQFVHDGNQAYITSNLVIETFAGNDINLIYICNTDKETIWGELRRPGTYEKAELQELSDQNLKTFSELFGADAPDESVSGVWVTSEFSMIVASRPILTSDDQGPVAGYLIMGRILTDDYIAALSEQTQVTHTYRPLQGLPPDAISPDGMEKLTEDAPFFFESVSAQLMHGYAVFPDIGGRPALLLQADLERSITVQGRTAIWYAIVSVCVVGGILLAGTLLILSRIVIRPLSDLTARVVSFDGKEDLSCGVLFGRKDEIGLLCREFKNLVLQLQAVNREYRETNALLGYEVLKHQKTAKELQVNQERLRALSSELVMTEERERRRLAVDLHDRIGQVLAALRMQIELLMGRSAYPPENAGQIRMLIETLVHDSRSLTFELSPPILYELGLGPAVEWLADEIMEHEEIRVEVEDRLESSFEDSIRAMLFRSIRELLYNVVKHARADQAWVRLSQSGNELRIVVVDNGTGFNWKKGAVELKNSTGFGLFSIQERFRQLGGTFDIRPGEKSGSVVTLSLLVDDIVENDVGEKNDRHDSASGAG